ncbi:MAG: hypothetical protein H0X22_07470 [Acidimicrobiia bacterium]|nr:hypothetical protein [Acidimicrobiia bacterium]
MAAAAGNASLANVRRVRAEASLLISLAAIGACTSDDEPDTTSASTASVGSTVASSTTIFAPSVTTSAQRDATTFDNAVIGTARDASGIGDLCDLVASDGVAGFVALNEDTMLSVFVFLPSNSVDQLGAAARTITASVVEALPTA